MIPEMMTAETTRRWYGIRAELGRLKVFDRNVYAEVSALLTQIDLLESDNDDLRAELARQQGFSANT